MMKIVAAGGTVSYDKLRRFILSSRRRCCYCFVQMIDGETLRNIKNTYRKKTVTHKRKVVEAQRSLATLEHLVPRSFGGPNELWNVDGACASCNNRRGNADYFDWIQSDALKERREAVNTTCFPIFKEPTLEEAAILAAAKSYTIVKSMSGPGKEHPSRKPTLITRNHIQRPKVDIPEVEVVPFVDATINGTVYKMPKGWV